MTFAARKCHHFLAHNPNKITFFTDHAALANLENIQLGTIKNCRTLRLLEDLMAYDYEVKHISVKQNAIADYLSHILMLPGAPACSPEGQHYPRQIRTLKCPIKAVRLISDGHINYDHDLLEMAKNAIGDQDYQNLIKCVLNKTPTPYHKYGI